MYINNLYIYILYIYIYIYIYYKMNWLKDNFQTCIFFIDMDIWIYINIYQTYQTYHICISYTYIYILHIYKYMNIYLYDIYMICLIYMYINFLCTFIWYKYFSMYTIYIYYIYLYILYIYIYIYFYIVCLYSRIICCIIFQNVYTHNQIYIFTNSCKICANSLEFTEKNSKNIIFMLLELRDSRKFAKITNSKWSGQKYLMFLVFLIARQKRQISLIHCFLIF